MEFRDLDRRQLERVWSIDRREVIDHVYRLEGGRLVLHAEHHDVRGWPEGEPQEYAPILLDCLEHGGLCRGAFEDDVLVGAWVLESRFIGRDRDRLQLKFLHVGRDRRGTGLGRKLFEMAVGEARAMGARCLYISATSSQNTVDFYLRRGCRPALEIDPALFELEPEDIHLEYVIP